MRTVCGYECGSHSEGFISIKMLTNNGCFTSEFLDDFYYLRDSNSTTDQFYEIYFFDCFICDLEDFFQRLLNLFKNVGSFGFQSHSINFTLEITSFQKTFDENQSFFVS